MASNIVVVMYHYVRDLKNSRYPKIKGLDIELFKEQLEYILKYYNVIRIQDIKNYLTCGKELPENSLLLTFDDAYIDHYLSVFPILNEKGIQGCFFPPVKAILCHEVLDVNKIHFILASMENEKYIVEDIFRYIDLYRNEYDLDSKEEYYKKYAVRSRFDNPNVIFVKRMLQEALPEGLRKIILNKLFETYVTTDEGAFSRELYMNVEQIKCMQRNGMYIGVHGYDHYWLNALDPKKQELEIDLSINFLKLINENTYEWVMCYPYGEYNESLLKIIKQKGCVLGFTTEVNCCNLDKQNNLILPRMDTNDLPKNRNAQFKPIVYNEYI